MATDDGYPDDPGSGGGGWAEYDAQIREWYQIILGRTPSQAELNAYHGSAGGLDAALKHIQNSSEHAARFKSQVSAWYRDFLGREATSGELSDWFDNNKEDIQSVYQGIKNSPEAKAYGTKGQTPGDQSKPPGGTPDAPGAKGGVPSGGWGTWFNTLTAGVPHTPAGLASLKDKLSAYGVTIMGSKGDKIKLPDGTVVDVITSAGLGGTGWQWDDSGGGGGAGGGVDGETGRLNAPYGETFKYDEWQGTQPFSWDVPEMDPFNPDVPKVSQLDLPDMPDLPEYNNPNGTFSFDKPVPDAFTYADYQAPDPFTAPTEADMLQDPSYKIRLQEGLDAVQGSAAARGSLMTGGTLKALTQYGQDQASKEYAAIYGRNANTYGMNTENDYRGYSTNRGNALDEYNAAAAAQQTGYSQAANAWGMNTDEYGRAYGYDRANVIDPYNAARANTADEWAAAKDLSDTAYNQQAGTYGINAAQYGAQYGRAKDVYDTNTDNAYKDWNTNYTKALNEYQMRYGIWNTQQLREFENLFRLSQLGQNSAVNS